MRLGPAAMEALRQEVTGTLHPGEELVVVGAIALGATERLLTEKNIFLAEHFSHSFLREAKALTGKYGIGKEVLNGEIWQMAVNAGANCLIEIGADGFLADLWKMAEASEVGLQVDLRQVPIRQETIEICECFEVNPYEACSGAALLAGFDHAYAFVEMCREKGIPAAVIGMSNGENARLLYSGETCRYLDRPKRK